MSLHVSCVYAQGLIPSPPTPAAAVLMRNDVAACTVAPLNASEMVGGADADFTWEGRRLRINCGDGVQVLLPTMIG